MDTALTIMPAMEIATAIQRRNQLNTFVKEIMIDGIDFGTVPGTDKPTLKKPGAEKLITFFGLTPTFEDVGSIAKWDGDEPLFFYRYKCKLYRGEFLIGEGIGSCNSRESKYRWRWVALEDLPTHIDSKNCASRTSSIVEFEFAINKRETGGKYGKPAEYWDAFEATIKAGDARQVQRKTSSGKELPAWEIATTVYRVPNEDVFSLINTIDKMAQKRALVAAALIGVNASEFFTQDLEDLETVDYQSPVVDIAPKVAQDVPQSEISTKTPQKPVERTAEATVPPPESTAKADKPKKQPQWSQAAWKFFQAIEEATNHHWQGNGWHFQKSMEKLGLNWSLLNSDDATTNAWAILTDYARQQSAQAVGERNAEWWAEQEKAA